MKTAVVQRWVESDSWSGPSPDGYSIHKSEADRVAFCKEYWVAQLKRYPTVPDAYSREDGAAYLADIDAALYRKIGRKNGLRVYDNKSCPKQK